MPSQVLNTLYQHHVKMGETNGKLSAFVISNNLDYRIQRGDKPRLHMCPLKRSSPKPKTLF